MRMIGKRSLADKQLMGMNIMPKLCLEDTV